MNEFRPKVSIVIPVYNGADYLREAVDSALAQTYGNVEVIVVNDGSSDGGETEKIARSYGDSIRYIAKKNGGVASALNAGIRAMTGEYVSWLSHDDVYMPDKLEVQVSVLQNFVKPVILYSDYYLIDDKSAINGLRTIRHESAEHFIHALISSFPVNGCTTLIPRLCFDDVGLFNERLRTTQDYDIWVKLSRKYTFIHIQKPLVKYRLHHGQGSRKMSDIQVAETNDFFIWCLNTYSVGDIFGPRKSSVTMSYLRLAANFKARDFTQAFQYASQLAYDNLSKSSIIARSYAHMLLLLLRTVPKVFLSQYWKLSYRALLEYRTNRSKRYLAKALTFWDNRRLRICKLDDH